MSEPTPEEIAAAQSNGRRADLQQKISYLPDIHRLLPQSPSAEQGILASLLLAPTEVSGLCSEKRILPACFHIAAHAIIFTELMAMVDAGLPVDVVTVSQRLRDKNLLEQCGGPAFVTELFCFLPTFANAGFYAEIVDEKHTLREIIRVCTEYAARSYDEQHNVAELLDELETKVLAIRPAQSSKLKTMKELASAWVESLEKAQRHKGKISGHSTGIHTIDQITDGLHPTQVIVIAAGTSHGKTALSMNIAEHIAVEQGKPIAVFSLEMSSQELANRMGCSRARVDPFRIRDGFLSDRDFPAITAAASKLASAPIYIDDTRGISIQELRARARRLKQKNRIEAVFVDYLQLLRSETGRRYENRQIEISQISAGLKAMAGELSVPVVVLCQISRDVERTERVPKLSDLRESSAIECDADVVAFLVRPEMWADNDEARKAVEGEAMLHIRKNRNGPLGDVRLTFLKQFCRFEARASEQEEETQQTML